MNIFVAGARGAIGRPLISALVGQGHAVTGMTRSEEARGGSAILARRSLRSVPSTRRLWSRRCGNAKPKS